MMLTTPAQHLHITAPELIGLIRRVTQDGQSARQHAQDASTETAMEYHADQYQLHVKRLIFTKSASIIWTGRFRKRSWGRRRPLMPLPAAMQSAANIAWSRKTLKAPMPVHCRPS